MPGKIPKIAYAQIANNDSSIDALKNVISAKPFVDYTIVVHNGINPEIETKLAEAGSYLIEATLNDHPSELRNKYLNKARELQMDYLLFSEPDEHFDDVFLASLRSLVISCPAYNGFEVYYHYEIPNANLLDSNEIARESPCGLGDKTSWWKLRLVRLEPDMVHSPDLVSADWRMVKIPKKFYFTQSRTAEQIWRDCARNVFITGGTARVISNNNFYDRLTNITKELGMFGWSEFETYCVKGNIDQRLQDLFADYRDRSINSWDSEIRSMFKWYYNLHPEENEEYLTSNFIPANYIDGIHDFVRKHYLLVLGRDPDIHGLNSYIKMITEGRLESRKLDEALINSEEFIRNFINTSFIDVLGRQPAAVEYNTWHSLIESNVVQLPNFVEGLKRQVSDMNKIKVAYCQMTYRGDVDKAIENVKAAKDYVDWCIVVYDDTLSREQIDALVQSGARARYYKWEDNFPQQRNNYLLEAWYAGAQWIMVSDPDEHFDTEILKQARDICAQAMRGGANLLMVPAHDIFIDDDEGHLLENPAELTPDYRKNLMYQLRQDVWYYGIGVKQNLHEGMTGQFTTWNLPPQFFYRHIKSHPEIWEHAARNMFIGGGGDNLGEKNPTYVELKNLTDSLGYTEWKNFRQYLINGKVDKRLKDWMLKHRSDYEHPWDSESREFFKWYYFILHRDEWEEEGKPEVAPEPERKIDETEQLVKDTYIKILGRNGEKSGVDYYTNEIKSGRLSKDVLQQTFLASEEYKRRLIALNPKP